MSRSDITFARVVRSEWTKLRSLRSTWLLLGLTPVLTVVLAGAFGYGYGRQIRQGQATAGVGEAIDVTFVGLDLFALIIGVFGILQITGEYGSGQIRASLTAVPRRWLLLLAKAFVLALSTAAVMGPAVLLSFLAAQAMIGETGAGLGDHGAAQAVIGATVYPVAMGLLGLGLGAVLRQTAVTITLFVSVVLILPALLVPALPAALRRDTIPYVPIAAAQALYEQQSDAGPFTLLSPSTGLIVLIGWVSALLALGALVLNRRDA
jgi:ABC-2 type transport system permease protein